MKPLVDQFHQSHHFSFPLIGGLDWWFGSLDCGFPFTLYKSQGPIQSKSRPIRTANLAGYLIIDTLAACPNEGTAQRENFCFR